MTVPQGRIQVEVTKGFEYAVARETVDLQSGCAIGHPSEAAADSDGRAFAVGQCRSARTHELRRGLSQHAAHLVAQQTAENLFLVENLVVNKEQRIPDIAYFRTTPDPASTPTTGCSTGRNFTPVIGDIWDC